MRKSLIMTCLVALCGAAMAFPSIPKESAKALGATKGKPFSAGLVFVNGKYIAPPYVVERWGTGIRINGKRVTGQVIDWNDFLKTQADVKTTTSEVPFAGAVPVATVEDDSESSLDDLFDDDPKPKKTAKSVARKPASIVTYSLEGEFKANDASRALLAKINLVRTEVDARLRGNGFVFFGNSYSRIAGDRKTATDIMEKLPELLQHAESGPALFAAARAAGLIYLNEQICEDLYANRIDYRKLQERRVKWRKDLEWSKIVNSPGNAL